MVASKILGKHFFFCKDTCSALGVNEALLLIVRLIPAGPVRALKTCISLHLSSFLFLGKLSNSHYISIPSTFSRTFKPAGCSELACHVAVCLLSSHLHLLRARHRIGRQSNLTRDMVMITRGSNGRKLRAWKLHTCAREWTYLESVRSEVGKSDDHIQRMGG